MLNNRLNLLMSVPPYVLIGAIAALEAVAFLFILPAFQACIAPNYGIGFADNYDYLAWNLLQGT